MANTRTATRYQQELLPAGLPDRVKSGLLHQSARKSFEICQKKKLPQLVNGDKYKFTQLVITTNSHNWWLVENHETDD